MNEEAETMTQDAGQQCTCGAAAEGGWEAETRGSHHSLTCPMRDAPQAGERWRIFHNPRKTRWFLEGHSDEEVEISRTPFKETKEQMAYRLANEWNARLSTEAPAAAVGEWRAMGMAEGVRFGQEGNVAVRGEPGPGAEIRSLQGMCDLANELEATLEEREQALSQVGAERDMADTENEYWRQFQEQLTALRAENARLRDLAALADEYRQELMFPLGIEGRIAISWRDYVMWFLNRYDALKEDAR